MSRSSSTRLPTGTVTFFMTDVEGSTQALRTAGDAAYHEALEHHRAVLRAAVEAHRGAEVDASGDAFFAAFARAGDAVAAALEAQRGLTGGAWPGLVTLAVRMGLHTGEAELTSGGYVGLALHQTARVAAAAHGSQILVSENTATLTRDALPPATELRALGPHRLKDLSQPERIWQVCHADLPDRFPPLRSLDSRRHNLPVQLTSFVGRDAEMAEVQHLLGQARLVTLTGAGGAGKTRLALQAAAERIDDYPGGVWLVDLSAVTDPALVAQAIVAAIGLPETAEGDPLQAVVDHLVDRAALILLDNCEHLVAACAEVADRLLRDSPRVSVLVTSREPLGVPGELPWRVPSLSLPAVADLPHVEGLAQYEAIRLFVERARSARPGFALTDENAPAVAQVCRRLDGIPLALELAASRVRVLSPEQIATRLDDRFRLLTGASRAALPRQQTLRATIDWSHDLLGGAERVLFRRLAVFAGGACLDAVEHVCSGAGIEEPDVLDILARLVDKSLVLPDPERHEVRYRMLESVRHYAREKLLDAGESETLRDRHLEWMLVLTESVAEEVDSLQRTLPEYRRSVDHGPAQGWMARLYSDHDNARAALEWAFSRDGEAGPRLAAALGWFWLDQGYWAEASQWLNRAAARDVSDEVRLQVLKMATEVAWSQGRLVDLDPLIPEIRNLARSRSDSLGEAEFVRRLGIVARAKGDLSTARTHLHEALARFRQIGDRYGEASTLANLGELAIDEDCLADADALYREALAAERAAGVTDNAWVLGRLAEVTTARGDLEGAMVFRQQALESALASDDLGKVTHMVGTLFTEAFKAGHYDQARGHLQTALDLATSANSKSLMMLTLLNLGMATAEAGQRREAAEQFAKTLEFARDLGSVSGTAAALDALGHLALDEGNADRARALFQESQAVLSESNPGVAAATLHGLGRLARVEGRVRDSADLYREAYEIWKAHRRRVWQALALEGLARVAVVEERFAHAATAFAAAEALRQGVIELAVRMDQRGYEEAVAACRTALGSDAFEAAWAAGVAMDPDEAMLLAFGQERPRPGA